jgi:hypothetical protein
MEYPLLPLDHKDNKDSLSWKVETTFHYCWEIKTGLDGIYFPMQLTDRPHPFEVALLLIGVTHISLDKNQF